MSKTSNKLYAPLGWLVALLLVAKLFAVVIEFYLPQYGVSLKQNYSFTPEYMRVDFSKHFHQNTNQKVTKKQTNSSFALSNMLLKGLYGNEKKGFVIVAKKSSPQATTILSIGESFNGYKLHLVGNGYALFKKADQTYKLALQEAKEIAKKSNVTYHITTNQHEVRKKDIEHFASNPAEIWKNISIVDEKVDNKLVGFRVKWIKRNSQFAKLGLKKGDVIIRVNNKQLHSYKDAIDIYGKISKISQLMIVVLRDGQEKEIEYEVH